MRRLVLAALLLLQPPAAAADDALTIRLPDETVRITRGEFALAGTGFVDPVRLERLEEGLAKKTNVPARNARFGASGAIMPEKAGQQLDRRKFESLFFGYFYGTGPAAFEPPMMPVLPKVDAEVLESVSEKVIGSYATYYNYGNKNRSHNIALAAAALDSTVVFPGETFSFNKTVGKRTAERGYRQAPVIVRGELSEGIGGGICQVSSTLFNAVDNAGLQIVERYSHSRHVAYVPPGRDATVSWYGPDFVFRNTFDQPVLIRAHAAYGTVAVRILSSETIRYKPRDVQGMKREPIEEVPDVSTGGRS